MTDKERILMIIITRIIPRLKHNFRNIEYITPTLSHSELNKGDLVFANTTIVPNDFMIGFVEKVDIDNDCVVIREIGSKKLCNYFNETFTKINKSELGYQVLEGTQYKIYEKVLKAFNTYTDYTTRFKSINFDGNSCFVEGRIMFRDETILKISFKYNSKTTIKSIGHLLNQVEGKEDD